MINLSSEQIAFIKKDIRARGVSDKLLGDDILDHFCCLLEEEMLEPEDFKRAYRLTLKKFGSLRLIQYETLQSKNSSKIFTKLISLTNYFVTLCYFGLSLTFLILPLKLALHYSDISFVLFFSPFVIFGSYILILRIDYRKFELIPYQKNIFPNSLVH